MYDTTTKKKINIMDFGLKYVEAASAKEAYKKLCKMIDKEGHYIEARNEPTKEILNAAVLIKNPRDRIIPIERFSHNFILQESFDILNENPPRVYHSKEMLEKTMGNSENIMFFGNEMRQAFSRWSLLKILEYFKEDKNTRKAILDLGNRRPVVHNPCLIYAHFLIRDDKLHLSAETRGTAISMGFTNDVFFFTLIQEIMLGWLREYYPQLEMGDFLYKTGSLHYYCDKNGKPLWSQDMGNVIPMPSQPFDLTYSEYIKEMGVLYHYIDQYMKAYPEENIDEGKISTITDCQKPDRDLFSTGLFYSWALNIYKNL